MPTGVGTPDGAAVSATIGAAGGSLTSDDGALTVTVPAGALAADTEVGIQAITNTAWGGLGPAYRLTPAGLDFATPVALGFAVSAELLAGTAPALLNVAYQDDQGFWFVPGASSYDAGAGTLTGTTTHFTDFSPIEQYRLMPARGERRAERRPEPERRLLLLQDDRRGRGGHHAGARLR